MTGTLVYDADCGFCTRSAQWASRHMAPGNRIAASHTLDLDAVGLTLEQVLAQAWWLDDDGSRRGGHEAIADALRASRRGWPVLGAVVDARLLRPVATRAYAFVARHRHRLPGSDGTCNLPH